MLRQLPFLLIFWFPAQLLATVYYVSQPTGNNSNNGTSTATAFKTIQYAANLVLPGDVVNVMNGTYTNACAQCDVVNITRAGTAAAWITFQNYTGHTPILQFNGWQGFKIGGGAAYIRISGFEVVGNNNNVTLAAALNQPSSCANPGGSPNPIYNGNGIAADGRGAANRPHHLRFDHNTVHDCGGTGISAIQSDYLTIEDNLIYNNSWYTIYATSGISLWQLWNVDGTTTTHNIIQRNRCMGNRLYVPWVAYCAITDGNGIIIDDSKNTQNGSTLGAYTAHTLVENNLVWNNGGSGIHTYKSEHVRIIHNTAYQNSQSAEINGGEIFSNNSNDIEILNNILWAADGNTVNSNYSNTNLTYDYNLHWGGTGATITGSHTITANPNLVAPDLTLAADFHLQPGSPAINIGSNTNSSMTDYDGNTRPYAAVVDLGAFEKQSPLPVVYLTPLQAYARPWQGIELQWTTAIEQAADRFEVQRIGDGFLFEKIGEVAARGTSTVANVYAFGDKKPRNGTNYYRLLQIDYNGATAYSNVVSAEWQVPNVWAVPNPVTDVFEIKSDFTWERAVLRNALGEVVQEFGFQEKGNLLGLPPGLYTLTIFVSVNMPLRVLKIVKI